MFSSQLAGSAHVAQSVEHFLGKEEVTDSSSVVGLQNLVLGKLVVDERACG